MRGKQSKSGATTSVLLNVIGELCLSVVRRGRLCVRKVGPAYHACTPSPSPIERIATVGETVKVSLPRSQMTA